MRIADIVELYQIDPVGAKPLQGSAQLSGAGVAIVVFELGREKNPTSQLSSGEQVADNALRVSIGGRGVDQLAAACHQRLHHFGTCLPARGIVADLETWEVPSPITGRLSPECGIGRAINPDAPVCALPRAGSQADAASPAPSPSSRRREAIKCP